MNLHFLRPVYKYIILYAAEYSIHNIRKVMKTTKNNKENKNTSTKNPSIMKSYLLSMNNIGEGNVFSQTSERKIPLDHATTTKNTTYRIKKKRYTHPPDAGLSRYPFLFLLL